MRLLTKAEIINKKKGQSSSSLCNVFLQREKKKSRNKEIPIRKKEWRAIP
jgi:hypothetical protein